MVRQLQGAVMRAKTDSEKKKGMKEETKVKAWKYRR
jgi:hypothetical protein